jgi:hypothetical protein
MHAVHGQGLMTGSLKKTKHTEMRNNVQPTGRGFPGSPVAMKQFERVSSMSQLSQRPTLLLFLKEQT